MVVVVVVVQIFSGFRCLVDGFFGDEEREERCEERLIKVMGVLEF